MDIIAKAVAAALAKKGIDVQGEYTKISKGDRFCTVNIPPNRGSKRNHVHKGVLHTDHIIQKSTTKEDK